MTRGEVYWYDFGRPRGSEPGKRRPVLVVQSDDFNDTRLATTIVVTLTSNTAAASMPGNVFLEATTIGLSKDSVVNVTTLSTVDRRFLDPAPVARVPHYVMAEVDRGLRQVLALR